MALKPVICISGFAAVGKSTAGKMLARRLGLKYFSGGDALKALAREMGYRPTGAGWWETAKGLEFLRLRSRDPSFDKKVDRKLLEVCRRGGVVVDSWVIPWLFKGRSLNIWITADKRLGLGEWLYAARFLCRKHCVFLGKGIGRARPSTVESTV